MSNCFNIVANISSCRVSHESHQTIALHNPEQHVLLRLQVKNFGRRGRTKYTHLVDQDTTAFDDPLAPDAGVARKFASKMAGTEQIFEKPKTYKT